MTAPSERAAGWVYVRPTKADVRQGEFEHWVDEGRRAVTPGRRVAELERGTQAG
jgi:hypothetical protein